MNYLNIKGKFYGVYFDAGLSMREIGSNGDAVGTSTFITGKS